MTKTTRKHVAIAAVLFLASISSALATDFGPIEVTHEDGVVRLVQNGSMAEIAAQYAQLSDPKPTSAGEPAAAVEAANRFVEQQVLDQIKDFRDEYHAALADNDGIHLGPPWGLSITGELLYQGPAFWTIDLETYRFTGGAHGGTENQALVLSRETGAPISASGLFKPHSDWLQRLSDASYKALIQREHFEPDDDWLARGTAPEPENYQVLLPIAEGIEVVFGQYQIGPYVIGISRVLLPYAELSAVLNPDLFPK